MIQGLFLLVIIAGLFFLIGSQQSLAEKDTISVSGAAQLATTPDQAVLSFSVETVANTAGDAQNENSVIMDGLQAALVEEGISEEDIETTYYSLHEQQEYDYDSRSYVDNGFRAFHSISVTTHNIDRIGEYLDIAANAGVTHIGNINFVISDEAEAKVKQDLLGQAAFDAEQKAALIADGLGVGLGKAVSVVETSYSPFYYARAAGGSYAIEEADLAVEVPIAPQEVDLSVDITVEFLIK